jgi:hypothetical protein
MLILNAFMFYRLRVIKKLSLMFNVLGLGETHRSDEFLANFIVDQRTESFFEGVLSGLVLIHKQRLLM